MNITYENLKDWGFKDPEMLVHRDPMGPDEHGNPRYNCYYKLEDIATFTVTGPKREMDMLFHSFFAPINCKKVTHTVLTDKVLKHEVDYIMIPFKKSIMQEREGQATLKITFNVYQ